MGGRVKLEWGSAFLGGKLGVFSQREKLLSSTNVGYLILI